MAEEKKALAKQKAPRPSFLYGAARLLADLITHTICPVRYHHAERLNAQDAPFIVMGNHQSLLDPILAGLPIRRYQVEFLGKKELAELPVAGWMLKKMHMIPVQRHGSDMEAMRACMRVTKRGGVLGIFPEGTRYHDGVMEQLESGVALIALRSKVPLIPVYISGKLRPFHRLDIYVGEPVQMDDLRLEGVNTETCGLLLGRISQSYADMIGAHTGE